MPQTRSQSQEDPPHNLQLSSLQQQIADIHSQLTDVLTPTSLSTFLIQLREQLRADTQQQIATALATRPAPSVLGPHISPSLPKSQADQKLRLHFPCFASGDPTDWIFTVQ